jgi:serine O-acetyltransferase
MLKGDSLLGYISADLRRQFYLEVSKTESPTRLQIFKRFFNPRFAPVLLVRLSHASSRNHLGPIAKIFSLINYVIFGIEVGLRCKIGPGLYFPHTVGTVIGAYRIGCNATIYHGVTLGAKDLDLEFRESSRPSVGDNVTIASGAKVIGGVILGDYSIIAANAVVTKDVASGQVVGGIPARPLNSVSDQS